MALGGLLAVLGAASLPLASNRPWSAALVCTLACLLACAAVALGGPGQPQARVGAHPAAPGPAAPWRAAALPLVLLAVLAAWIALQLAPGGYTAHAYGTRQYLMHSLGYAAVFVAVLGLCRTPAQRQALLCAVLVGGAVQAVLAIGLFSSRARYEFLGHAFAQGQRATGTFANPDHLANYMTLALAAGIGLMLTQLGSGRPAAPGWRSRVVAGIDFMLSRKMLVRLTLVVLVITLVLTRSRAGNGAFLISVLVLGGVVAWRSARLRVPALVLVGSLLVVDIIVIGQWVGLDKVVQRLQATDIRAPEADGLAGALPQPGQMPREESLQERMRAAEDSLRAIAQRPWAGWGGGAFYVVYPQFKGPDLTYRYDHTHMDYIELVFDIGAVGLALLAAFWAATAWRVMQLLADAQPTHARGVAAGVGMAMLCAFIHAFVDFNLHITANALTLTALMALPWTLPLAPARGARRRTAAAQPINQPGPPAPATPGTASP